MAYKHLSDETRCDIYELKVKGFGIREIAEKVGRDKGTVSRELRRNKGLRGYRPSQAHRMASERLQVRRGGRRVEETTWQAAAAVIKHQQYSPEQAAGHCVAVGLGTISHETIYRRIYADKQAGGTLWRHLRCGKKRRKRYGSGRTRRGQIPNRRGIEERDPSAEDRATIGHWEGDLVLGKNQKYVIVTLVERRSGYAITRRVRSKNAHAVAAAIIEALTPYKKLVRSITFDNGLEFAQHEQMSKLLEANVFFATPYSSWQRGTNENYNGLLRQYFPKGSCFSNISASQLARVEKKINTRPRKRFAWSTPHAIFGASAKRRGVALAL